MNQTLFLKKVAVSLFSISLFVLFSNSTLPKDDVTRKTLTLSEFKNIALNANYTIYLKQTNKQEVTVEALSEIFQLTKIAVKDGTLVVNMERDKSKNKSLWDKLDKIKINPIMKIYVSMKDVKDLSVNGGGKIIAENSISSKNLNLSVTGSGDMEVDVKGETLHTNISGSGNIELKGYASTNNISLSGSGSLHAYEMSLEKSQAKVSGSGSCEINVSDELKGEIYGSGNISHKGNTKSVTKKTYGNGNIQRAY
ncbi:head GIN domain-containing protein [Fulvivirgaceae bacterium BMA12]|uniref:Head GIN domain-containing protein n=1 Tax=Agaribacillus aureus TaxID=3051825 RepID=A0ABT8LHX6_9BACT|nr:head GIN domain-containing protein [Fulvivirgaceae bacterium BMA12]